MPDEQPIAADEDVVRVRQLVRNYAQQANLSLVDQTKLVTATSELARNTLIYGGGGLARVEAVNDGWSTGKGLGLGLSGARRLVDEFELDTEVGRGTDVTVVKWKR
jgi:serine/threonine-protein kinase RsbT